MAIQCVICDLEILYSQCITQAVSYLLCVHWCTRVSGTTWCTTHCYSSAHCTLYSPLHTTIKVSLALVQRIALHEVGHKRRLPRVYNGSPLSIMSMPWVVALSINWVPPNPFYVGVFCPWRAPEGCSIQSIYTRVVISRKSRCNFVTFSQYASCQVVNFVTRSQYA